MDAAADTVSAEVRDDFLAYARSRAEKAWYADKELTPLETSALPEAMRVIHDINETVDFDIPLMVAMERMRAADKCRVNDILEVVYGKIARMKREPLGAVERCFYEASRRRSDLYNTYYG
jgi:hypothetical protein